ncbi:catalase [Ramlibacter sp. Leaf400]|uniref:catalase n=1 Tax=Ramlibacter sp. Leaf400 TaxID=1736365 RepID=UPI0006FEFE18|nr:catalase [Ramlibacter sp. Leaf400]KQT12147.1 hydroperoxidase [Ramlibacter sp. Leaf400]
MAQSKPDAQRRSRSGDAATAKHKQLESFSQAPENLLTTTQGVVVPDNHGSLRAGARGPTLLEDFLLREKLTHFDRERIPERVVNARGASAHGHFELYRSLGQYTKADFLQEAGLRTPVFVRFSGFSGERGSADTVRDLRGFAVKFYTREGNYDLVGASAPVFFIQDAMKFPDLVHALKPEPHHGMPQASSAHDTFWDFVSLMPESTHALMWLMSDRALPRSWRMMEFFGVHSFRFINAHGASHFVKFHWKPKLGRHALAWDEAQKLAGRDPDFLRRDLWESIARGHCPEWELGVQLVEEGKADALGIDLLDPTKLIPEEVVPVQAIGKLVLNRNPENFFAESEQVAFNPGHLVPGIDFSNDPLLQGRLFSYLDAQVARLGGANFHELPINRSLCPFHNHQRDGLHRIGLPKGQVSYEPNTLANGSEFRVDGGHQGFQSHEDVMDASKVRRRSVSFDDHYSQATLFWNSQGPAEKDHIVCAFQNELARVETPAIRQRVVDNLAHVDARLARKVAEPLGMVADAKAAAGRAGFREHRGKVTVESSPALSMESAVSPLVTRRVAVLVDSGVEIGALKIFQQALAEHQVTLKIVAGHLGVVSTSSGQQLQVDHCFLTASSVLFDAVLVPGGAAHAQALAANGRAVHFVLEAYRHCKPICVIGEGVELLRSLGIDADTPSAEGVLVGKGDPAGRVPLAQEFIGAMARHRHWTRSRLDTVMA